MKKQIKKRIVKDKHLTIALKIIISLIILIALVGLGLLVRNTFVGEATQYVYDVPPDEVIDLQTQQYVEVSLAVDPFLWSFMVLTSAKNVEELVIKVDSLEEDETIYQYEVKRVSDGSHITKGLLNADLSSTGNIYLDNDDIPDIIVSLSEDGYIKVANLEYVPGDTSEVEIVNLDTEESITEYLIRTNLGEELNLKFTISSTKTPSVEAYLDDQLLEEPEWTMFEFGTENVIYDFTFTPDEEKAYILTIISTVDDQITTKKYIIGVGGYVYALREEAYPEVAMKELDEGKLEITYTFKETFNKQPFSLPCGTFATSEFPEGKVNLINAFLNVGDGYIQQWMDLVPSDLLTLYSGKGYLLRLTSEPFSFAVTCDFDSAVPPDPLSSNLKTGWNLIGIKGYSGITKDDLESYTPAKKSVTELHEVSNIGTTQVEELQPGKAYWVKVE